MKRLPLVLLAALAAVATTAPAHAATLTVEADRIVFTGDGDERNELTAIRDHHRTWFRDDAAEIRLAGGGDRCRRSDDHAVDCATPHLFRVDVDTGGGADDVRTQGVAARLGAGDDVGLNLAAPGSNTTPDPGLLGGDGDDRLTGRMLHGENGTDELTLNEENSTYAYGGPGDDVITGSPKGDIVFPGPGADVVRLGEGDDAVRDDVAPEHDDVDAGPGQDSVYYDTRTGAVAVDVVAGRGGAGGDEDRLAAFEIVWGGDGDDVLRGGPTDDRLFAGRGDDVVDAGEGADEVEAGPGTDRVEGGGGRDVLSASDGDDTVSGGEGDDLVIGGPDRDALFGEGGNDRVEGSAGGDLLDGGAGDDRLTAAPDRFRDRALCGDGSDTAEVERVDTADAACERVVRVPMRSLLADHLAARGRVLRLGSTGTMVLVSCRSQDLDATVEVRRRGVVLGRGRVTCDNTTPAAYHFEEWVPRVGVRLPRPVLRTRRRVPVTVMVVPDDGSIPSRMAARLVPRR